MNPIHRLLSRRLQSFLEIRPPHLARSRSSEGGHYRISVVVPSYNKRPFLERTLYSILNQGYPHLEIIVIDGGSDDGTIELLEEYSSHIAYWTSEPDAGQADAINKGIKRATGDIIAWQNADDVYFPGAFKRVDAEFHTRADIDLLSGTVVSIDERDRVMRLAKFQTPTYRGLLRHGFIMSSQGVFWRRSIHDSVGLFDTSLHHAMDYDFWLRVLRRHKAEFIPQVVGGFRVYPGTKTSTMGYRGTVELNAIRRKYGYDHTSTLARFSRLLLRLYRLVNWQIRYLPRIIAQ